MDEVIRVGDSVTLPSGAVVKVTVEAVRDRPWAAIETGWVWHVCRFHQHADQPCASFYYGGKAIPVQLQGDDAKALADLLNRAL